MSQNSNFRLPRGHRFCPKFDFTVMAPNHGADPLGSILGPMGSHWVKKWVKTVKNYHAPKFEFSTTQWSSFWAKIRLYRYGAKSRWGPSWVHLGANGCPLGKKWVKTVKNYYAPKFKFSTTPWSSILAKIRLYGYGAKSRWGPPRFHLGANGVPLVPKSGSKPQKITMPQNSNFRQPRGHRFWPKFDFTVMAPNHGGDPLGSILGPMGSYLVQKMGQSPKKLPCPKIRIFDYPPVIDFVQNSTLRLWRQITVGTP